MTSPKTSTIKRLFAVSGNQCAYPGCTAPLVEPTGTVTGKIAHIKAASENGPRFDESQSEEERHGFNNLILLCGRHHTIIDTEVFDHPAETLIEYKKAHEESGTVEITPHTASVAQALLTNYQNIVIQNNTGQVAVNSPGAIQANTLNLKTTKKNVTIAPPDGSVSSVLEMRSYIEYLIAKYQDYQKQDKEKTGNNKYRIIYNAIRREYGCKWQLVPADRFDELVRFLHRRIDNTKIGRIRKHRDQKRHHSFDEHIQGKNA
uniref:HNH endonuclease n=1 Tax=Candidatus Kentrum sp. LPFa TaxID=2126335 RepID=A0A450WMY0_9GAMM|nr:MAG: hypothetical protein BECKLPF1236B_GA0070989_11393 [Candidatus Kentron sp. LPFa]